MVDLSPQPNPHFSQRFQRYRIVLIETKKNGFTYFYKIPHDSLNCRENFILHDVINVYFQCK